MISQDTVWYYVLPLAKYAPLLTIQCLCFSWQSTEAVALVVSISFRVSTQQFRRSRAHESQVIHVQTLKHVTWSRLHVLGFSQRRRKKKKAVVGSVLCLAGSRGEFWKVWLLLFLLNCKTFLLNRSRLMSDPSGVQIQTCSELGWYDLVQSVTRLKVWERYATVDPALGTL